MLVTLQDVEEEKNELRMRSSFRAYSIDRGSIASASSDVSMSFIKQAAGEDRSDFNNLIHALVVMITEIRAGVVNFYSVIGITKPPNF